MKNKIEQFARNHWNDNLSIAWRGGGSEDFGCVTVKIYLNTLLATTDSPSVPLTVIPPPPQKKKPPTLSVLHDLNDIWFQIAKGTFEISLTGERETERQRERVL